MQITDILKNNWKEVLGAGLICGAISVGLSLLFFPLQYEAESQVLVIFESKNVTDAYTAMRSAEKIGESITTIVETSNFMAQSLQENSTSNQLQQDIFKDLSEKQRRQKWNNSVDASLNYNSNVVTIRTYHTGKKQAKTLNNIVVTTLIKNIDQYTGPQTKLKVVNPPLASKFPMKPNLFINFLISFLVGLAIAGAVYTYQAKGKKDFFSRLF